MFQVTQSGNVMIRDVRHIHRGTPNLSETPRPMVVVGYSRRWLFRPEVNIRVPAPVLAGLPERTRERFLLAQLVCAGHMRTAWRIAKAPRRRPEKDADTRVLEGDLSAAIGMFLQRPVPGTPGDVFAPLIRDTAGRLAEIVRYDDVIKTSIGIR